MTFILISFILFIFKNIFVMNIFILLLCSRHRSICLIDFDIRILGITRILHHEVLNDKNKILDVFFCMCVCLSSCTVPSIAFFVHVCTCMFQYFSLYVCTHISSCIWGLGDWNSVCTADIYSSSTDFKFSDHCIQSYIIYYHRL